jgi:pimeloyl-ACP methyl ester carboxylesterase
MNFHHIRLGQGKPLVLFHGLGSTWRSWQPVLDDLAAHRSVIALDLPGFGDTPPLQGPVSIETLADASAAFLDAHDLQGADVVGSSMGARLVLELARRGVVGSTVSLDPGGFWRGWEKAYFRSSIAASIRLVRALQPVMPTISRSAVGRTLLLAQLSAHPSRLSPDLVLTEMRSFAASPSFDELLRSLVSGPEQQGVPPGSGPPITIGWGRKDRVCLPKQARTSPGALPQCEAALVRGLRALPDVGQVSRNRAVDPQQHKVRSPLKGS